MRIPKYVMRIPEVPVTNQRIIDVVNEALIDYRSVSLNDVDYTHFGTFKLRVERAKFLRNLLRVLRSRGELNNTIELGSGGSTIIFSKEVAESHTAVEHLDWAHSRTSNAIMDNGLYDVGRVLLRDLDDADGMYKLNEADLDKKYDLLLIDGPPVTPKRKGRPRWERWNTLPFFMKYLNPNAIVILDSSERTFEQEVLERWCQTLGISFMIPGPTDSRLKGFGIIDPFHSTR